MAGIDKTYIDGKDYSIYRQWWIDNYDKMKTEQNLNNAETQTLNIPVVNRSIYPIITKSEMWIGCGNVEYLVETTTEIGENYGGQSSRVIESRSSFQYCG